MDSITVDTATAEDLRCAIAIIELRDSTGKVLGRFRPAIDLLISRTENRSKKSVDPITLEATAAKRLHSIFSRKELRDPSGNVLGHFVPVVSEEELDRRERESGRTYTTAEVLRILESLGGN